MKLEGESRGKTVIQVGLVVTVGSASGGHAGAAVPVRFYFDLGIGYKSACSIIIS